MSSANRPGVGLNPLAWPGQALVALLTILVLPGRIGQVYGRFTPWQATITGVGFVAITLYGCFSGLLPAHLQVLSLTSLFRGSGLNLLGLGLTPVAVLVVLNAILRRWVAVEKTWGAEWFLAVACLLPVGYVGLLQKLFANGLGVGQQWLTLVAIGHGALILYFGYRRIFYVPAAKAAIAVPIVLLATGWLTRLAWLNLFPG